MKVPLAGALFVSTKIPSVVAKPVSFSSVRAFLIEVLDWFAQLIGSLSILEPASRISPSTGISTATSHERQHRVTGQAAEAVDRLFDPARDRFVRRR